MIIDLILDRQDGFGYSPKEFYDEVSEYDEDGWEIARALDSGTERDIKKALCDYVVNNDYNADICDYINSVKWLEEEPSKRTFNMYIPESKRLKKNRLTERGDYNDACFRAKSIVRGLKRDFDVETIRLAFKSVLDDEKMAEKILRPLSKRVKESVDYNGDFWKSMEDVLDDNIGGYGSFHSHDGHSYDGYWSWNKGYVQGNFDIQYYMEQAFMEHNWERYIEKEDFYSSKKDTVETYLDKYNAQSFSYFLKDKDMTYEDFKKLEGDDLIDLEDEFLESYQFYEGLPTIRVQFQYREDSHKMSDTEKEEIFWYADLVGEYDRTILDIVEGTFDFEKDASEEEIADKIADICQEINKKVGDFIKTY